MKGKFIILTALLAALSLFGAVQVASAKDAVEVTGGGSLDLSATAQFQGASGTLDWRVSAPDVGEDGCTNANTGQLEFAGVPDGAYVMYVRRGGSDIEIDAEGEALGGEGEARIGPGHGIDLAAGDQVVLKQVEEVRTETARYSVPIADALVSQPLGSGSPLVQPASMLCSDPG